MKKHRMKMTSLLAFEEVIPNLQNREMEVLKIVKKIQPCNNRMIQEHSNRKINEVTPRVKSLRELNIITYVRKDKCPYTNKLTDFYQINKWIDGVIVL